MSSADRAAGDRDPSPSPIRSLSARLAGLRGWRRLLAATLFGALSAAALPPVYAVPLLWLCLPALLWLLDGAGAWRAAAGIGWAFGFGHFLAGLYWVAAAFLVDPDRHAAAAPFAVLGLAAGMALFTALVALLTHLSRQTGVARVLVFAAAWLAAEWLRSWLFTGFPWNLLGSVWAFSAPTLQVAALAGVWGLSWLTLLAAAAPAALTARRGGRALCAVGLVLLAGSFAWGWVRLEAAPAVGAETVPEVKLRLVQPNIPQALKWRSGHRERHVADQMELGLAPGFETITHVIWAETAVPFDLSNEPGLRANMSPAVPRGGLLLAGAPRFETAGRDRRLWNALHAMDQQGDLVATYDKATLVPFGEYTPFRSLFALLGLGKLTAGGTDFSAGPGPVTLTLPGLPPVSPLICYEVIFPDRVIAPGPRPQWLLTVTNDAWFGVTSGPYQHFASARLRAVEQGLPLVRVANTGISGIVDPYGRVWAKIGLEERGILDSDLPTGLAETTVFARLGNWTILMLVLGSCIVTTITRVRSGIGS